MTVYKVVRKIGHKRYSCVATGKARIQYYINRQTEAPLWLYHKNYGLCVFRTLTQARTFVNRARMALLNTDHLVCYEIWKCKADKVRSITNINVCAAYFLAKGITKEYGESWPPGTLMVDQLQLGELIKE